MRLICIVLLATLAPAGWAADVYRCKGRSGETVYSEHPCDGNAQPMKLRDNRPASTEAATGEVSEPGEGADPDNGIEQARENQRACTASATAAIYGPSNDRIAGHQHQLLALRQQLDAGGSSVAADQGSALRAKIAALRQAITAEHAAAHSQIEAARQRCQQQYRREPARS